MSAVARVAKPVMRGLHVASIKRNIILATLFASATSLAWYFTINKPRIQNYKNFYATYDVDKDFERMRAAGIFQSCAIIDAAKAEAGDEEEE